MGNQMLTTFYFANLGLIFLVIVFTLMPGKVIGNILWSISLLGSINSFVLLTLASGHLPVSGDFEKYQAIGMILITLGFLRNVIFNARLPENLLLPVFTLALMAFAMRGNMTVSDDYLIYGRWDVMLFFYCRKIAIALFVLSVSEYVNLLILNKETKNLKLSYRLGRNLTLLGGAFLIAGELSGSIWALYGWGDPWRWSGGFFISGAMFILSMLALHIPPKWTKLYHNTLLLSAAPLLVILILYIY